MIIFFYKQLKLRKIVITNEWNGIFTFEPTFEFRALFETSHTLMSLISGERCQPINIIQ